MTLLMCPPALEEGGGGLHPAKILAWGSPKFGAKFASHDNFRWVAKGWMHR